MSTRARKERGAAELDAYPHSGGIFAMRVEVPGLPATPFAG